MPITTDEMAYEYANGCMRQIAIPIAICYRCAHYGQCYGIGPDAIPVCDACIKHMNSMIYQDKLCQ